MTKDLWIGSCAASKLTALRSTRHGALRFVTLFIRIILLFLKSVVIWYQRVQPFCAKYTKNPCVS